MARDALAMTLGAERKMRSFENEVELNARAQGSLRYSIAFEVDFIPLFTCDCYSKVRILDQSIFSSSLTNPVLYYVYPKNVRASLVNTLSPPGVVSNSAIPPSISRPIVLASTPTPAMMVTFPLPWHWLRR